MRSCFLSIVSLLIWAGIFNPTILLAEADEQEVEQTTETLEGSLETRKLSRITVLGGRPEGFGVGGSSYFMDQEELDRAAGGFDDVHRVLRHIPGVNIQEEEGFGLRPNIGFRGVPVERSSSITVMEDGVLAAPAAYSAPAAYYFPIIGRMEGLEVLKGAGQIKYGPRTTGGSLNLLSTSIPNDLSLRSTFRVGGHNTRIGHLNLGDSYKNVGWLFETYQGQSRGFKELDGGGDTGFDIQDYVGKFRVNSDPAAEFYQELEFKIQRYDEISNETYLGLTDEDFRNNPLRRYAGSQRDRIDVERDLYQLTHYVELSPQVDLTTILYRHDTERSWYKLQSVGGNSLSAILDNPDTFASEYAWITGENSPDNALVIRENRREYYAEGVQTALGVNFETGQVTHDLEFGVRYHRDEEDRFQQEDAYRMENGSMVLTNAGAPGSQDNRIGKARAWAFYLQDRIDFGQLSLTPGLRYENIDYTRTNYGREDPTRSGQNVQRTDTSVDVWIPGISANYDLSEELRLFAGVHRGFAPPGPATSGEVREERSINYELGTGFRRDTLKSELVFFYNDYDNLLGADTLSGGGEGTGDLFNAGESRSFGVEALARYNLVDSMTVAYAVPARLAYTYTNAQFRSDFDSNFFGDVRSGDSIPYIPEHQLSAGIGFEQNKLGIYLDAHYVDAMPTAAGLSGVRETRRTDSHVVTDLTVNYALSKSASLFASVHNLFDEEYVVARRPAGARPGMPRTFFSGVKFDL